MSIVKRTTSSYDESPAARRPSAPARAFQTLASELVAFHGRLRFANALCFVLPQHCMSRLRTAIYRRVCGIRIGARSMILGTITLSGEGDIYRKLTIGEESYINAPLYADLNAEITIGSKVDFGHHVVLITTNHDTRWPQHRCGAATVAPITIKDGSWIGACVTILPGVTVGEGAVVGAGSVVAQDVPPHTTVWGIPARVVAKLPTEEG